MSDRRYWHVTGARTWHAQGDVAESRRAACGYAGEPHGVVFHDRIPPTAHLCGNCARVVAARTDVEDSGSDYGTFVSPV